jgi:DnaJ-class molecular chaperone
MAEPLIQVRFPCENCDGTGLVDPGPIPGGVVLQNNKLTCRACGGNGAREDQWISVTEFRERFLDGS